MVRREKRSQEGRCREASDVEKRQPDEEPKVSDRRILAEVGKRLEAAGNLDLTLIRVDVSCGEATIDGGVTSEAEVALVEEIVCGVPGITACQNNLRVVDGE